MRRDIDQIVNRIVAAPMEKDVIIVDDCSSDGTRRRLEDIARDTPQAPLRILLALLPNSDASTRNSRCC
jgi:glycosyltransferase involved in cell wall biosynthesis